MSRRLAATLWSQRLVLGLEVGRHPPLPEVPSRSVPGRGHGYCERYPAPLGTRGMLAGMPSIPVHYVLPHSGGVEVLRSPGAQACREQSRGIPCAHLDLSGPQVTWSSASARSAAHCSPHTRGVEISGPLISLNRSVAQPQAWAGAVIASMRTDGSRRTRQQTAPSQPVDFAYRTSCPRVVYDLFQLRRRCPSAHLAQCKAEMQALQRDECPQEVHKAEGAEQVRKQMGISDGGLHKELKEMQH